MRILYTIIGKQLVGSECTPPLPLKQSNSSEGNYRSVVIAADYVTVISGTGIVHTAPGHGMEDFIVCKEYGLNRILCPGKYLPNRFEYVFPYTLFVFEENIMYPNSIEY